MTLDGKAEISGFHDKQQSTKNEGIVIIYCNDMPKMKIRNDLLYDSNHKTERITLTTINRLELCLCRFP